MHAFANNAGGITALRLQPRGFLGNARSPCTTERSDPVLRGHPSAARVAAETGGCVMCDTSAGAAGTPRTGSGRPSPAAATSPGGFFRTPSTIRTGYGRDTNSPDRIQTAYGPTRPSIRGYCPAHTSMDWPGSRQRASCVCSKMGCEGPANCLVQSVYVCQGWPQLRTQRPLNGTGVESSLPKK
jgi:hypothetical protein